MKINKLVAVTVGLLASALSSSGATFIVSNLAAGPGTDTLFANNNGSLMNGGVVAVGYFGAGVTTDQIDTIPELTSLLAGFTAVSTVSPGSESFQTGLSLAGYADGDGVSGGVIGPSSALLGRTVYAIVTNAASLVGATNSNQFALFAVGNILDDSAAENSYIANPAGRTPIIGTNGVFNGDAGLGEGEYATLNMAVVPEPSAALLGLLGVVGFFRRRR